MNILLGPELIWAIVYGAVALLAKANQIPTPARDKLLENLFLYIPLAALLTFLLWYVPVVEKRWLFVRIWFAGLVLGHFALEKGLGAHSEQGPGIGTAYIFGLLLLFFALTVGTILVKVLR